MKAQSFQIRALQHQIAACLRLIAVKVKSAVLRLIDLEEKLEVAMSEQLAKEPKYIQLVSYRMKGINAYLVKEGEDHTQHDYGTPIDEENQQRAHRKKRHTVKVRIDHLPDGIYRFVEAGGADFNKVVKGYLKIADGKIAEESDNLNSLIVGNTADTLPELDGSQKQIDWALSIREKFIAKLKQAKKDIPDWINTTTSAKWYIDNRATL